MDSKERLLRSFRHEPVDRIPVSTYELVGHNPDAWENREPSYARLMDEIRAFEPRLIVLDELAVAIAVRLVTEEAAWRLIDTALEYGDTVVTGRYAGEKLVARADYISRIEAEKHPFEEGQPARRGIEF